MASDPNSPETLVEVSSEFEASSIIHQLAARDIKAFATTDCKAGYAPRQVSVLVRHSDLDKAKLAILEFVQNPDPLDWTGIDVGLPEDV